MLSICAFHLWICFRWWLHWVKTCELHLKKCTKNDLKMHKKICTKSEQKSKQKIERQNSLINVPLRINWFRNNLFYMFTCSIHRSVDFFQWKLPSWTRTWIFKFICTFDFVGVLSTSRNLYTYIYIFACVNVCKCNNKCICKWSRNF